MLTAYKRNFHTYICLHTEEIVYISKKKKTLNF